MARGWSITCPEHGKKLYTSKTIPFNHEGERINAPIFFCEACGIYYLNTPSLPKGVEIDYKGSIARNSEVFPEECEIEDQRELLPSAVYEYTDPFVPVTCPKDNEKLTGTTAKIRTRLGVRAVNGLLCNCCGDFYVETDEYEELTDGCEDEFQKVFRKDNSYKKSEGSSTSNEEEEEEQYVTENHKIYTMEAITVSDERLDLEEVQEYLSKFEDVEANFNNEYPFSLLHYAFLFRKFDVVNDILLSLEDNIDEIMTIPGPSGYEWITPLVCAKWNLYYIYAYDDKHGTNIVGRIEELLETVENIDEVLEYDEIIGKDGESVFDIVWGNVQPLLDVIYFEYQELASKQIEDHGSSIAIDEVGTGKTVTALYAIRNVIAEKQYDEDIARVLIVCPYNKREDWQSDIRRQLGRYAHIVEQGDNGIMYRNDMKKAFFKNEEHIIMITGQKQSSRDKNGSYSALKETLEEYSSDADWDLVVIDEAHISFNNYHDIRANSALLLTATPIVVNSYGKRTFADYKSLLSEIVNKDFGSYGVNPVQNYMPSTNDLYVNWFREDFGRNAAERTIKFIGCSRHIKRDELYDFIKSEKGELAALTYDQDDNYLFYAAKEQYGYDDVPELTSNGKLKELIRILKDNNKSYIIFCEHQFVVDLIFESLKNIFVDDVVAAKYGKYENQMGLGNIQDGQLVNTLMQALRAGQRAIFITTGKSGGTGLNLGEFDGVIHYELPFTSIELEQRFGRVDRLDTQRGSRKKDMIFLLNKCGSEDSDIDINRMLYYCTTKIDITCQYMPIRNTVLYYPEFIKRNGVAIRETLEKFQGMPALSEINESKIKDIRRQRRAKESSIRKNENWLRISNSNESVYKNCTYALSHEKKSGVPDEFYKEMSEYVEYVNETKSVINEYQRAYRQFSDTRKFVNNWLAIIGLTQVEESSEIFAGYEEKEDGDQLENEVRRNDASAYDDSEEIVVVEDGTVQGKIRELIRKIDSIDMDNLELLGFSSEGVFCYVDNTIKRSSVSDYRKGLLLK